MILAFHILIAIICVVLLHYTVAFEESESVKTAQSLNLFDFDPNITDNLVAVYDAYLSENQLSFATRTEYDDRFKIFRDNVQTIKAEQLKVGSTAHYGITPFSHLSRDDFIEYVKRGIPQTPRPNINDAPQHVSIDLASLPASVDWAAAGGATPVKNQGQVINGSCWTFSTTGALEGAYFVAYGVLPYPGSASANGFTGLSEQQLTACTLTTFGCNGGWSESGFIFAAQNDGLNSEAQYPYLASTWTSSTNYTCSIIPGVNTTTSPIGTFPFTMVPGTVSALMSAVAQQPVAVGVAADSAAWQFYSKGVITTPTCGTSPNHAVVLVGYGTDTSGTPYWKIKNSWGTNWGEAGYVRILRNSSNICGILSQASSYPNVQGYRAPTMSPTAPVSRYITVSRYFLSTVAYILPNSGGNALGISVIGANLGGGGLPGGIILPAIGCICTAYRQSNITSVWVFGAVSGSTTYLVIGVIRAIKVTTNWNLYLYMNPSSKPLAVPSSAPLSCAALNQYVLIQSGNFPSWAVSAGYATSNTSPGISLNNITYNIIGTNAPTNSPSVFRSAKPSLAPTAFPTAQPTVITPSGGPSVHPTRSPSAVPVSSLGPTAIPSMIPSPHPSQKTPSDKPTTNPTQSPTLMPTLFPTTPTIDLAVNQTINGFSYDLYLTNTSLYNSAIANTISTVLSVDRSAITNFNVYVIKAPMVTYDLDRKLSLMNALGVGYSVVLITAPSSVTAQSISNQLLTSCSSGAFISTLHQMAKNMNAQSLMNASSSSVIVINNLAVPSAHPIAVPQSNSPSILNENAVQPNLSSSPSLVAIVTTSSVVLGLAFLIASLILYWKFCKFKSPPPTTDSSVSEGCEIISVKPSGSFQQQNPLNQKVHVVGVDDIPEKNTDPNQNRHDTLSTGTQSI